MDLAVRRKVSTRGGRHRWRQGRCRRWDEKHRTGSRRKKAYADQERTVTGARQNKLWSALPMQNSKRMSMSIRLAGASEMRTLVMPMVLGGEGGEC